MTTPSSPIEIEDVDALDRHLARTDGDLAGTVLQGLDLRARSRSLLDASLTGATFMGCRLESEALAHAHSQGALIFPPLDGLPFDAFRNRLYTAADLYEGFDPADPSSYAQTLDARVYQHFLATGKAAPPSILETLARRLHDHAISDALEEALVADPPRKVVAIMGGHSMARGSQPYAKVARIARALTRAGFFMVSGGGPGAMEATHVGAWFAPRPDEDLDPALAVLAEAPSYKDTRWLAQAFEVRRRWPLPEGREAEADSLGIPTWLYGHEPPNPFATRIAKYFANSVREDGLLAIATHGVVFSPGSAGTIQEVFQDACQNHYLTCGVASPMVFLDVGYWTETKPVYPLLKQLAEGKEYARWLDCVDDEAEVVARIQAYADAQGGAA